jgi:hypothetical protein
MEHVIAEMLLNFEQGKMSRRQLIQSLALAATAASALSAAPTALSAAENNPMKATYLNHVGYRVGDYKKTCGWYAETFGLKVVMDDGTKAAVGWANR